jgi:hypothetical protein
MGLPANDHLPSLHLCYEKIILTSLTTDQDKIIVYRISQKGLIKDWKLCLSTAVG